MQVDTRVPVPAGPIEGDRELGAFDADGMGVQRIVPPEPMSASYTACDVTIPNVRYICNPDLPASEGTSTSATP